MGTTFWYGKKLPIRIVERSNQTTDNSRKLGSVPKTNQEREEVVNQKLTDRDLGTRPLPLGPWALLSSRTHARPQAKSLNPRKDLDWLVGASGGWGI